MCIGRSRPKAPKAPKVPKQEPMDSPIEKTATKVLISDDRSVVDTYTKKKKTGTKVTGGKVARAMAPRRLGTRSLQIPLLANTVSSGNLNYS